MAKRNIAWQSVEPGQIVMFRYKGRNSNRRINRTVLCINPEVKYKKLNGRTTKFFVGLQLDTSDSPRMTPGDFTKVIGRLGGLMKKDGTVIVGVSDADGDIGKTETSQILKKVKQVYRYLRTYNLRECKRSRVFLETEYQQIPKNLMRLFNVTNDMMQLNEN